MIAKYILRLFVLVSLFALAACLPKPTFTINPDPAFVGEVVTFDASTTYADAADAGIQIKSAKWTFGDKDKGKDDDDDNDKHSNPNKAEGKIVQHTYNKAGTYKIKLKIKDSRGRKSESTRMLIVKPRTTSNLGTVSIRVQEASGATVPGASVKVGVAMAATDAAGAASLSNLVAGANQVVTVSKPGYITQSLITTVTAGNTTQLPVHMRAVGETLVVGHIEAEQRLIAGKLGASVTIPANAFVKPDGAIATGLVLVDMTPWDITGSDLSAMLGNGRARDAAGQLVDLISAGMMTVDFRLADGTKLQLAAGKTAKISMDLPYDSINGQALAVGSSIPTWYFDETQGLWIEEGAGSVVSSDSSSSGLALEATVTHFSTWNWDFKFENAGSVTVQCVGTNNVSQACDVVADVTLPDGAKFTRSTSLPVGGATVVNMPTAATIVWTANAGAGIIGTATSGTSGSVNILLAPATTRNFVQCQLANATPVACSVAVDFTLENGSVTTLPYAIAAEGSTIATALPATSIDWRGSSALLLGTDGNFRRFNGTASSGVNGNVVITLSSETLVPPSKYIRVTCDFDTNAVPADSCDVQLSYYGNFENRVIAYEVRLIEGETRWLGIPPTQADVFGWGVSASTVGTDGNIYYAFENYFDLDTLIDGQLFTLTLGSIEGF